MSARFTIAWLPLILDCAIRLASLSYLTSSMSGADWMPDAALVNQVLECNSSFLSNVVEKARK
ncbi:hypothetical protein A11M_0103870 [Xanthomonas vasicola pv. vasculorum NCPPB 895]|uniref:Uncharacterized protein n=1 Tax=Xanthomonas vasicola pv. vasculorum NCPPB 890 TaxID=1184265 RepID=A0A837B5U7_XANVA|nr:hypothetical protein A11M_0103870 [Xanthomonas vasicola pv. vasculorum NCPPB 895]KFA29826.1 hypothetical protein KWG_0114615 [Xanthomonas vasicola pv. vasculorum NCPPB 1381]KFA31041.1 hypothetical protein KW5_0103315 [Xanthomonas vasicola pv. vasculorum NCPPB 1326]KFA37221.1 hypothetical protein KWI_0106345 [Xanthomonas vasicola pv. vasculorum NCPPB 206]